VDCVLVVTIEQKEVVAGTADQRLVGVASDVAEPRIYLLEPKTKMTSCPVSVGKQFLVRPVNKR